MDVQQLKKLCQRGLKRELKGEDGFIGVGCHKH